MTHILPEHIEHPRAIQLDRLRMGMRLASMLRRGNAVSTVILVPLTILANEHRPMLPVGIHHVHSLPVTGEDVIRLKVYLCLY